MTCEKARVKMRDMTQKLLLIYQAYDTGKASLASYYRLTEDEECIDAMEDEDNTKFPHATITEVWETFTTRYDDLSKTVNGITTPFATPSFTASGHSEDPTATTPTRRQGETGTPGGDTQTPKNTRQTPGRWNSKLATFIRSGRVDLPRMANYPLDPEPNRPYKSICINGHTKGVGCKSRNCGFNHDPIDQWVAPVLDHLKEWVSGEPNILWNEEVATPSILGLHLANDGDGRIPRKDKKRRKKAGSGG